MIALAAVLTCATALGAALLFDPKSLSYLTLAIYVLAIAEIVAVVEALSLVGAVTRTNLLAAQGLLLVVIGIALVRRRRTARLLGPGWLPDLRDRSKEHPLVVLLLAFVVAGLGYQLALVLLTPPNNWDSMAYHLSRAAAWYQHHEVSYIPAHTARENAYPPNAEILVLYTLVFAHGDRYAAIWQWLSNPVAMVGIFVLARRAAFTDAQALFGALLFACLSQVALQTVTTQNDLIAATLVVAAAAFLVGGERGQLWLGSIALALAVGTKLTSLFAIPVLLLIAAVVLDRRAWRRVAVSIAAAVTVLASFGFVLNVIHTGSLLGARSATAAYAQNSAGGFARTIGYSILWIVLDFRGLPGAPANEDLSFYGPLGILVVVPLLVTTLRRARMREATRLEGVFALALPIYLVSLAFAYRWNPFVGRFLITPAALLAPLFARVYRSTRYATVVVGVAVLSLSATLLFDYAKPSGIGGRASIWSLDRAQAQAVPRPPMKVPLAAIDVCVPAAASVGYVLGNDDWDYPLYGSRLSRRLVKLPAVDALGEAAHSGLEWVFARQRLLIRPSSVGWRSLAFPASGLRLYRRAGGDFRPALPRACDALFSRG